MKYKRVLARLSPIVLGLACVVIFPMTTIGQVKAESLKAGVCQPEQIAVSIAPGQPADQTVTGTYCTPYYWHNGQKRVDVLVHGATYNSSYWDFPYDNADYSYVNDTLLAGRATFAYNDVGTSLSSHPNSNDLTFLGDAYVLHQLIGWVHSQGYSTVDAIGHSKGSAVVIEEAGQYQDVSAVVVTGLLHKITTYGTTVSQADFVPANQDPQFAGLGLDNGYLTTVPNTRGQIFYSSIADPKVIAYDEAHKDFFAYNEFAQSFPYVFAPADGNISNTITAPVLTVEGQQDKLFCGDGGTDCSSVASVKAAEAPYYQHAAAYDVQLVPLTGHDIALHPTNTISFLGINTWLQSH